MRSAWPRLLVLLAVLLMPFGMSTAAGAAPHSPSDAMAAMPHCPDSPRGHSPDPGFVSCTMACSAALPAVFGPSEATVAIVHDRYAPPADAPDPGGHAPNPDLPPPRLG